MFFLLFHFAFLNAQDNCGLRISLLTCSPGNQLYSTFGHSAIRVIDSTAHDDIVFNYGTFDFSEPNFYIKFIRGKLSYYLSTEDYNDFESAYRFDNRGITEQLLNLSCEEKNKMYNLLINNLQGTNKFYKYDFFFDNCTTRLRDLLENSSKDSVTFHKVNNTDISFRQMLYQYLKKDDQQWSKLGIDILLGCKSDRKVNAREIMFLPDYLMKSFDSSSIGEKTVVAEKKMLIDIPQKKELKNIFIQPLFSFTLLFLLIAVLSFFKSNGVTNFLIRFDGFLFFTVGVTGIFLLLMWFGTDHKMFGCNLNLLWAWPLHTIAALFISRKKKWLRSYFLINAITNAALLLSWNFLPQHFNAALIPVVLLLLLRSIMNFLKSNHAA